MINKPSNWDRIAPSTGTGFPKLPADGYVVKIYNDRGWVLGGVYVTERIIPGVVI